MRFRIVIIVLATAMAAGMLLSPNLWLTERMFPHAPVWDGLPGVPPPWDRIIFVVMLGLLVLAAVLPRPRWPLLGFVVLAGTWSLWDQSRWQPWFYQYLFMLTALGIVSGEAPQQRVAGLNVCRFILAATYFWSGIQKMNYGYATAMHPWVFDPILQRLPEGLRVWFAGFGWQSAGIECVLGMALLVPRLRLFAAILLAIMHAAILYCLSPLGHDWNSVVWPWNMAMIILNLILFSGAGDIGFRQMLWPAQLRFARLVLLLFGVMPLFSFFNCWDAYLSAALYSGNTLDAKLHLGDTAIDRLPIQVRFRHMSDDKLDLFGWSMDELNVPDFPARRVFRAYARKLSAVPGDVTLDIGERPNWRTGERITTRELP